MKRKNRLWPGKFVAGKVAIDGVTRECKAKVIELAKAGGCSQGVIVERAVAEYAPWLRRR